MPPSSYAKVFFFYVLAEKKSLPLSLQSFKQVILGVYLGVCGRYVHFRGNPRGDTPKPCQNV